MPGPEAHAVDSFLPSLNAEGHSRKPQMLSLRGNHLLPCGCDGLTCAQRVVIDSVKRFLSQRLHIAQDRERIGN